MAAFASDRRSGWVRVLVLILFALFLFATIATPPAYAVGETVALFGLAAVLSAATAALGFKLANNAEGQATLQNMVQDFTGASIAAGLVLTGSKVNGLINGMQYIKMAVHNGKTYLDERVAAWCQQWLTDHGVYDAGGFQAPDYTHGMDLTFTGCSFDAILSQIYQEDAKKAFSLLREQYNISVDGKLALFVYHNDYRGNAAVRIFVYKNIPSGSMKCQEYGNSKKYYVSMPSSFSYDCHGYYLDYKLQGSSLGSEEYAENADKIFQSAMYLNWNYWNANQIQYAISNFGDIKDLSNTTGLSGTDTLGEDYVNKTLEQILAGLKEWAQDWFDAGADSLTNAATGAKDLPLSVATGAATLNPDVAEDGPLVWFPAFDWPLGKLRSGETDTKTVDQGKENASAAETSTVDVAENQTVINSLVNWALNYIDPDTGLFSKFPLCVPYDAYLLVTSSLGVDAVGSDSIFGASPGDLDGVVTESIDTYSDFQPIININNDFELDGKTYPISISIDLTPWQPLVTFFREGMALLLIAELIGSEYKRIRGH